MTRIVVDSSISIQLERLSQPAEVCDTSGKVLGRFTPVDDASDWEYLTPDITAEELKRRCNSDEPRYTTAEVLKYLEQLECGR